MRKLFATTIVSVAFFGNVLAQDQADHGWLEQLFPDGQCQVLMEEAPEKVSFYVFADEHGYAVEVVEGKDLSSYPDALEVAPVHADIPVLTEELVLSSGFHPSLYRFQTRMHETRWYRVGDSQLLITVFPLAVVQQKYNAQ